jgi:vitamin B12 transporter
MKYIVAFVLCCATVQAQERLDEVIVSDTRIPKSRKNSGKAVVKITAKEIAKNQGISLAQLLNQYAGMYISGAQTHPGQNLSYFIRGGNNRQVLVRIDGVVVSDPAQIESDFDLRLLALDQIESIEVVKGASSSLYGSGAATAVIDITTKNSATEKTRMRISREWGTQNTLNQKLGSLLDVEKQYVQLERSVAKIGLSASFSRFTSDGMSSVVGSETDEASKDNFQFNAKSQYDGPWGWKAFFHRDIFHSDYDGFNVDAPNTLSSKNNRYGVSPSFTTGKSHIQAHVSWSDSEREFISDFPSSSSSNVFTSELTWRYRASDEITLLTGGLFQDFSSESSSSENSPSHENLAFFVSTNWQHANGYALQLSGRNTVHSTFGAHQTFNINPYYVLSLSDASYWKIFGSWATSFIAPTQYKLFNSRFGNLNLEPEENRTYEVGIERVSSNSRITLVGFHRKETNVIIWNPTGYTNSAETFKVKGIELEGDFTLKSLNIQANYTFTEKVDLSPIRLPKHAANLGLTYASEKAQLGAHLRYVGSRNDSDFSTFPAITKKLEDFVLVDVRIALPNFIGNATATLAVTNLFDAEYIEIIGFSPLGRNLNVGLRYAF